MILVEGARQVGKSRLVEHLLSSVRCPSTQLNLEVDARLRSQIDACQEFGEFQDLLEDRLGFDPRQRSVLYIDEAQESLILGQFVRSMKERWPKTTTILTGSTLSRLFRKNTRFPVGRVTRLIVRPFTFVEYLRAMGKTTLEPHCCRADSPPTATRHWTSLDLLDGYLQCGGLPEVVMTRATGEEHLEVLKQLLAGYEQDFIRLFGEEFLHIALACFKSVAYFVGSPSKYSTVVAQPTGKVLDSIKEVFARLENWHMVLRSPQYGSSASASHDYHPKRYLFDTGLLSAYAKPPCRPSVYSRP